MEILLKVALNTIKQANNLLPKNVLMGLVLVLRIYELIWFSFEEIYECRVFFKFQRQHYQMLPLVSPLRVYHYTIFTCNPSTLPGIIDS